MYWKYGNRELFSSTQTKASLIAFRILLFERRFVLSLLVTMATSRTVFESAVTDAFWVMFIENPWNHARSATGPSVLHIQPKRRHSSAANQNAEEIFCEHYEELSKYYFISDIRCLCSISPLCLCFKETLSCNLNIFFFNFFRSLSIFNFAVAIGLCKAKGALHPGKRQSHDYLESLFID